MDSTVDPSAAEREPELPCDNPSPHRGHRYVRLPGVYYICPGRVWTPNHEPDFNDDCSDGWHESRQEPTGPCPTCGDVADCAADQLLDREREPADDTDIRVALAVGLAGQLPEPALDWSAYEACPSCWAQTGDPCVILGGYNPSTPHPDRQLKVVEPERRTVSLEVLTDELRASAEADRTDEEPEYMARAGRDLLAKARVGVVARVGTESAVVTVVDTDWVELPPPVLLARLIEHARGPARDGHAELLMPGADVLAALDGRPDAQLLTAPVWVLAMDITAGMLLHSTDDDGDGAETLELVTAERDCDDPECIHGATCVVLTVGGHEDPEVHFNGYSRIEVRIPVSVTP